jgi:hypothetical protein
MDAISAIIGAVFYILAIINTKNLGEEWYLRSGNSYFFIVLIYVGAVMAIFSGFYIGSDYSDGTIRNKINVGCTRSNIYLANLVVIVITGILFTITHMVASVFVGLPFLGELIWQALAPVGWRLLTGLIVILCYAAIFTFFAMQDSNKSRSLIISFVLALVIILGGLYVYGSLQEPELTSRMVMQEDGSFLRQEGFPNSRYIDGTARTVYTFVNACIPSAQAYNIDRSDGEFDPLAVVCMLGVSAAFTAGGITGFKKKDIK